MYTVQGGSWAKTSLRVFLDLLYLHKCICEFTILYFCGENCICVQRGIWSKTSQGVQDRQREGGSRPHDASTA